MQLKHRKRLIVAAVAGAIVAGGGALALPALSETGGTIAGHFTENGAPVPNAFVTVWDTAFNFVASTQTDASGAFQFDNIPAGGYKVQFNVDSYEQWSVQKGDFTSADVIMVTAGQTTSLEEAVRPTGSITGTVRTSDGAPASFVQISATALDGGSGGHATTDNAGSYTLSRLLPGTYRVSFFFNGLVQYANNATTPEAATPIVVTAGSVTVLDQTQMPTATVSGTIRTATGQPAPFAVLSFASVDQTVFVSAFTNFAGQYQVKVWPGTYTVSVQSNGLQQYVPGKRSAAEAGHYTFGLGVNTLDETLLATGLIGGALTRSDGGPVAFASVFVSDGITGVSTITDSSGHYSVATFPGSYKVQFSTIYGTQFAHGKQTRAQADSFAVTANGFTTVNEVLAPFGSVTVTGVDSVTGAPVAEFCVDGLGSFTCTTTGSVTIPELLPGSRTFSVHPDFGSDSEYLETTASVDVVSGVNTPLTVAMTAGGSVTVTMTDHNSGEPVANACLVMVDQASPQSLFYSGGTCSGSDGTVTIRRLRPGSYKAFVRAKDGVHGHQWVGQENGVGEWRKAKTVTITSGATTAMTPIRLDGKGSLTGTVTDEVTGEPISRAAVTFVAFTVDRSGGDAQDVYYTDSQGRYTIPDLGPYQWSVFYSHNSFTNPHAGEWTGDEAERDRAGHIKVKEDRTVTYDATLGKGTTITGHVLTADGTVVNIATVWFYDADTNELIAERDIVPAAGTAYVVHVKGPRHVKVKVFVDGEVWLGGTSIENAQVVDVPASGSLELDLPVA